MALSFSLLFASKIVSNAAADTLFTMPATPSTSLLRNGRVRFANDTAAPATIAAWAVPNAGAAGSSNVFLPVVSIPAKSYIDVDLPNIGPSYFVQAQAGTVNAITVSMLDGFIQS